MFEPISAACLYAIGEAAKACTIVGITGGIAGNLGDRILCNVTRATADHFIQNVREPVNHDLLAGMIAAHEKAFRHYAATLDGQATAQDRHVADKIIALAKKDVAFDIASTQTLMASVTPLIAGAGDKTMAERRAEFVGAAVSALVAWMEAETRETLPAHFVVLFTERAPNGRASWAEQFQLHLAETIKDEKRYGGRFKSIFIASNIAELVGRAVTIQELAEGILTSVEALHGKVDSVKDDTSRILALIEPKSEIDSLPAVAEQSAELRRKTRQAKTASERRNAKSAHRLWTEVSVLAAAEGLPIVAMVARLQIALTLARDEGNIAEALKVAETCLHTAQNMNSGRERCRLNQLLGEIYRINGDSDRSRGFLQTVVADARKLGLAGDEGWALLAISELDRSSSVLLDEAISLEKITQAYDAFSRLFAGGEVEGQRTARFGFAQCHESRADIIGYERPDELIAEWNQAVQILKELGKGSEWELGDALVSRAKVLGRQGNAKAATVDLNEAATQFGSIRNPLGQANCHLVMAEMIDRLGEREESAPLYRQAATIAASSKNDRRSSYFLFRHACKLVELGQYGRADQIFDNLLNADWLETSQKLDVASQLCMTAEANRSDQLLNERAEIALAIIDELRETAKSASHLRSLDSKAAHFYMLMDRYDDAERCYNGILARLHPIEDAIETAECWSHIRSLMQKMGDKKRAREAGENALRIGGDRLNPIFRSIELCMLAQINIEDERYGEAQGQLDLAKEIDPNCPMFEIVGGDLRSKLPRLSADSPRSRGDLAPPPEFDFPHYIRNLHRWAETSPKQRKSILSIWYFIHRDDLWATLRSALGVKFLIAAVDEAEFDSARTALANHGDIFVWGTNFSLKATPVRGRNGLDCIPVPWDYRVPAGVPLVVPRQGNDESCLPNVPQFSNDTSDWKSAPYFVAAMKTKSVPEGVAPHLVGRKQLWSEARSC